MLLAGASPAAAAPCDVPIANEIACENTKPGNPASEWDVSGAGHRVDPGLRDEHQRGPGADGPVQGRHAVDGLPARHLPHGLLRRPGRPQDRDGPAVGEPAAEPAGLPEHRRHRPDRLRQLGACRRAGPCRPTPSRASTSPSSCARTATAGSSHVVFVVRDDDGGSELLFQTSDTTWQAYNQYGGNSLYTGQPGRPRVQGQLQPPVHDPRHRRRGLGLQRRVPDGPLARAQRLRRLLHVRARQRPLARPSCSSTRRSCPSATTSTGPARSAPTSRPRARPA